MRSWRSTTPSPHRCCRTRWPSARTSSCTARPSSSAATPTCSSARWCAGARTTGRRLIRRREVAGATPGALECFLALRGARTLAVRLRQAQESAGELARRLAAHPAVGRVRYPGLPDHPHHALAARQMRGYGAVLSFEVARRRHRRRRLRPRPGHRPATSLGGVESTIERREKLPGQEHVPAGLLRLSVGCEHVEDLWADLDNVL